jgi:hypothetical protein
MKRIKICPCKDNLSPEDGSRAEFRNVLYNKYIQTMNSDQRNIHIMNQPLSRSLLLMKQNRGIYSGGSTLVQWLEHCFVSLLIQFLLYPCRPVSLDAVLSAVPNLRYEFVFLSPIQPTLNKYPQQ